MFTLPPTRFWVRTDLSLSAFTFQFNQFHNHLPVLLKGPCTVNGGLVVTCRGGNVVSTTVSLEASLALGSTAGVVCAVGFNHVVFDERVAGPSVHGEVAVALRVEGSTIVDGTAGTCQSIP